MDWLKNSSLTIAWLITVAALIITLVLSEAMLWPVCHMCWYQRICIYPQAIILGIAAFRNDHSIVPYAITLSVIGLLFAIYQYLMQLFPLTIGHIGVCGSGPSCSITHMNWLGFITLPLLSVIGFIVLIIFLAIAHRNKA